MKLLISKRRPRKNVKTFKQMNHLSPNSLCDIDIGNGILVRIWNVTDKHQYIRIK